MLIQSSTAAASESSPAPLSNEPWLRPDAAEIEPHHGAAELVEAMIQLVDERVVHRPAILRMRVQDQRHRRVGRLLTQIARFDPARRAGKDDVRHETAPARFCAEYCTHFVKIVRPARRENSIVSSGS